MTYTPAEVRAARQYLIRLKRYIKARPGYETRFGQFVPTLDVTIDMLSELAIRKETDTKEAAA